MAYDRNPAGQGGARGIERLWQAGNTPTNTAPDIENQHRPISATILGDDTCTIGNHVAVSRTPVLSACRELLAAGLSPDAALQVFRNGVLALRVRSLAEGARLTVREDRGAPEFARHKALPLDAVRPRTAIEPEAATKHPRQAVEVVR